MIPLSHLSKQVTYKLAILGIVLKGCFFLLVIRNYGMLRQDASEQNIVAKQFFSYRYKLCLLTKVRNMPKLLAEWLEYHAIMGVDQFFIADDCSDDANQTRFIMEVYQRAGLVSGFSNISFNDCVNRNPDGERLYSYLLHHGGARDQCKWIGAMDVDEYMTLQTDLHAGSLRELLDSSILPVIRMPWMVMGSDGHLKTPPGLLLEGFLNCHKNVGPMIKTLVKSSLIIDWRFSHWPNEIVPLSQRVPPPTEAETSFLNGTEYATAAYPLEAWMKRMWRVPEEERIVEVGDHRCKRPTSPLYMRHYKYLSWEQFMEYRGKRMVNAESIPEPKEDKRARWEKGHFMEKPCSRLSVEASTQAMAAKIKASMHSRLGPWLQKYQGVI